MQRPVDALHDTESLKTENSRTYTYFSSHCKHYLQKDKGEDTVKATGIVRRIDDLGRVVIPKEIRRTMRIREGV